MDREVYVFPQISGEKEWNYENLHTTLIIITFLVPSLIQMTASVLSFNVEKFFNVEVR